MPESNVPAETEALSYLADRFGVAPTDLTGLTFYQRSDEIWVVSVFPPEGISWTRPPGLRAFRRMPDGLKPTSALLILLGERITASRIPLNREELRDLLLGRSLDASIADGYVALSYRGDVVGCGRVRGGRLQALIPTGRRRELLEILSADQG